MKFRLKMIPPTTTAQMHKVGVRNGKPFFYDPPQVKQTKMKLMAFLAQHVPEKPLTGPLVLQVDWIWPANAKHGHLEWRDTKPDTDNLQKLLKDCMTQLGFWEDDAQVVVEAISKLYSNEQAGIYVILDHAEPIREAKDE